MTEFQTKFLGALSKMPNRQGSTAELATRLRTSRVAVVSSGRALERAGRAVSWRHGDDQWAVLMWAARTVGVQVVPAGRKRLCRDCADFAENGICPNDGKPCSPMACQEGS